MGRPKKGFKNIIAQRKTKDQVLRGEIMQIRSKSLDKTFNSLDICKKDRDALILLGIKGGEEAKRISKLVEDLKSKKDAQKEIKKQVKKEIKKELESIASKQRREDAKKGKEQRDGRRASAQEKAYYAAEYLARVEGMSIEQIQGKIGRLPAKTIKLLNEMGYK